LCTLYEFYNVYIDILSSEGLVFITSHHLSL
jgi:hypothetical protein